MLTFLLIFLVVGIDFARMYYVRGELQSAADSAALAGAKKLDGTSSPDQLLARQAAWQYACRNTAAGGNVFLATKNGNCDSLLPLDALNGGNVWSNTNNNATGDIVVGNWNGTIFTGASQSDATIGRPINAVQVVARRTSTGGEAGVRMGNNPIGLLFGNLVGWSTMDVIRTATATIDLNIAPLPICLPPCGVATPVTAPTSCSGSDCFPGLALCLGPSTTTYGLAWTNFQPQPQTGNCPSCSGGNQPTPGDIIPFIDGSQPVPNVCGQYICTTNGGMGPAESALQDRLQAEIQKHPDGFDIPGQTTKVKGWQTFVPVVEAICGGTGHGACPGAPQPNPYHVVQFSKVVITYVGKIVGSSCNFGMKVVGFGPGSSGTSSLECSDCSAPPFPDALFGPSRLVK